MKCEKCGEKNASFFYKVEVNGHATDLALCHTCAAKAGLFGAHKAEPFPGLFTGEIQDLFGDIFEFSHKSPLASPLSCPQCGSTWQELAKAGRVGCPECYATFGEQLSGSIRAIHGNATHTGKAPAKRREATEKRSRLEKLKKELAQAIETENFEDAARLRDEIRALDSKED